MNGDEGVPTPTGSPRRPVHRSRIARRLLLACVLLLALMATAGAVYQSVSERRDLARHPAPGRLVDVGGHRLHLHCLGSGTPTVLLEAGLGNDVNFWTLVQPRIATFTRVCAYDRAGLGWSDAGPQPRDPSRIVGELGELLERSGERPPYVVVGHSNGAPHARLYAASYPGRVAGLVLVDPNPENAPACDKLPAATQFIYGSLVAMAPLGVPRLALPSLFPLERSALPPEQKETHGALRARTSALRALWSEWRGTCALLARVREAKPPGAGIPIIVLSAARKPPSPLDVARLQRQMADKIGAIDFLIVEDSGHWIHLDRPDAVVDAVRRITRE